MGLNNDEDFISHAPYSDKTMVRNLLACDLFASLGHFGVKGVPVELCFNNDYQWIYIILRSLEAPLEWIEGLLWIGNENLLSSISLLKLISQIEKTRMLVVLRPFLPEEGSWKRIQCQLVNPKVKSKNWKMDTMRHWVTNLETEIMTMPFNKDSGYSTNIDLPSWITF